VLLAKVIMHLHLRCRSDPIRKRRSCLPFALFTRWHSAQLNAFALLLLLLCFGWDLFLLLLDLTPKPLTRTYALRVAMEC